MAEGTTTDGAEWDAFDPQNAEGFFQRLLTAGAAAGFSTEVIGTSAGGRPLHVLRRKAVSATAPHLLLSTGIHGDEPAGPWAVLSLLGERALAEELSWTIFPLINPDGLALGCRENAEGLDLNRDFKLQRSSEICALTKTLDQLDALDLHLSLHEDWEYDQSYLYEINTSARASFADALLACAEGCTGLVESAEIDGHTPCAPGLIRHAPDPDEPEGWPEAIYLVKRQPLLSYTLETPSRQPLGPRIACHRSVILASACALVGGE